MLLTLEIDSENPRMINGIILRQSLHRQTKGWPHYKHIGLSCVLDRNQFLSQSFKVSIVIYMRLNQSDLNLLFNHDYEFTPNYSILRLALRIVNRNRHVVIELYSGWARTTPHCGLTAGVYASLIQHWKVTPCVTLDLELFHTSL